MVVWALVAGLALAAVVVVLLASCSGGGGLTLPRRRV